MILNQTQELNELFSGLLFEPVDDFEIQQIYDKIFPAQAMARTFVEGTQSLGRDIKQGTTSLAQKAVEKTSALKNRAFESARAAPIQMSQAFNPLTEHITTGTQDMRDAASSGLKKVSNFFGNIGKRGGKKNKRTKHLRKNKTQKRKKRTHTRR
jgi:aspartate ammonia-lyase